MKIKLHIAIAALVLAIGAAQLPAARNFNPGVLPPQSHPNGLSYGDWGAKWWAWAYAAPLGQDPINDPDGRYASTGQSGPVWFLAGTFGATAVRTVTIPAGKQIFFPIVNIFNDYPCPDPNFEPPPGQTLEEFLAEGARWYIDHVTDMSVTIDGVELQNPWNYRATSSLSTFTADPSWVAMDPCVTGSEQVGVADGYWIMLASLPVGQHTIRFTAAEYFPEWDGTWALDVTYYITVK